MEKQKSMAEGANPLAELTRAPKQRDPEVHQTQKGNQWFFGMKAHTGVDSRTKLIHHVVATAANVHDSDVVGYLLHGDEIRAWKKAWV